MQARAAFARPAIFISANGTRLIDSPPSINRNGINASGLLHSRHIRIGLGQPHWNQHRKSEEAQKQQYAHANDLSDVKLTPE